MRLNSQPPLMDHGCPICEHRGRTRRHSQQEPHLRAIPGPPPPAPAHTPERDCRRRHRQKRKHTEGDRACRVVHQSLVGFTGCFGSASRSQRLFSASGPSCLSVRIASGSVNCASRASRSP